MTATLEAAVDPVPDPPQPGRRRKVSRRPGGRLRGILALLAISAVTVVPVVILLLNSLNEAEPGQASRYGFQNWIDAFQDSGLREAIWNTLELGVARTAIALVIATALAWVIARTNMPGRKFVEISLWLAFFVPSLSTTLGWILLLDPNSGLINEGIRALLGIDSSGDGPLNIFSFWGIVLAHLSASTVPFMTILILPSFRRMGSVMEESSQTCGASRLRTALSITIPLMSPALISAAVLGFIISLKAFEIELLLGGPIGLRVYSTQIYDWTLQAPPNFGAATALGVVFIPIMILMAVTQRYALKRRNYVTVGAHTFKSDPIRLGKAKRWVAAGICILYVLIMEWMPLSAVVTGSFMRRFGYFNIADPFTSTHWADLLADNLLSTSAVNSLILGVVVTVVGVAVYFAIGYAVVRSSLRTRAAIDVMAWLPVALPGILLGLGLLWLYLGTPLRTVLYGNLFGLAIALVITHMATGTQQMKSAFLQVSADHERAARTCGATPWRASWDVLMPLLAPSAVAVAILAFDAAFRDISTVILLSSSDSTPLSLLLLQYSTSNQLEDAAALGVLMSIITVFVGVVATRIGRDRTAKYRRRMERGKTG